MTQPQLIHLPNAQPEYQRLLQDQTLFLGLQSYHQTQLETKIKNLELKLEKKNQLVKYLEKKCGNQIIKCSRKFEQKIKHLQVQNGNLKKTLELFTLHNQKSHINILQGQYSEQISHLDTSASNIGSNLQILKNNKTKVFYEIKQDLINLTEQQLKQVILLQSLQLKKIWKENQIGGYLMMKCKNKDKKQGYGTSKKNSLFLSLSETNSRDSNQNFNKLNVNQLALKDTTNFNLNINSIQQFHKKSSPILSYRAVPQLIQGSMQTQIEEIPSLMISQEYTQTNFAQEMETFCQTDETIQSLQQMERRLFDLKQVQQKLNQQICTLKLQNLSLKEQVSFFSDKIHEYCQQLQKQHQCQVDKQIIQIKEKNPIDFQNYIILLDNYIEVLQIYGIQPLSEPLFKQNQQKIHKKLINQICGMKLQISQIIKQFKKLQRQLNESFFQRNHLQEQLRMQEQRIFVLDNLNIQLNQILQNVNEQLMSVRNKQLHWRMLRKYQQEENSIQDLKVPKLHYKKPLTERKSQTRETVTKTQTKSQQHISFGEPNEEDKMLIGECFKNEVIVYEIEDVQAAV